MPITRHRRIVRRTAWTLAGSVLLLSGYVGSYLAWGWGLNYSDHAQFLKDNIPYVDPLFSPLNVYKVSDLPLSRQFLTLDMWFRTGFERPWSDCSELAERVRKGMRQQRPLREEREGRERAGRVPMQPPSR